MTRDLTSVVGSALVATLNPTLLGKGSARMTFLVGIVLSFPGVSYLNALEHIDRLNPSALPRFS